MRLAPGLLTELLSFICELRPWNSDWVNYCLFPAGHTKPEPCWAYLKYFYNTDFIYCSVFWLFHMYWATQPKGQYYHNCYLFTCEWNNFSSGLCSIILVGGFSVHRLHMVCTAWQCKSILCCSHLEIWICLILRASTAILSLDVPSCEDSVTWLKKALKIKGI